MKLDELDAVPGMLAEKDAEIAELKAANSNCRELLVRMGNDANAQTKRIAALEADLAARDARVAELEAALDIYISSNARPLDLATARAEQAERERDKLDAELAGEIEEHLATKALLNQARADLNRLRAPAPVELGERTLAVLVSAISAASTHIVNRYTTDSPEQDYADATHLITALDAARAQKGGAA